MKLQSISLCGALILIACFTIFAKNGTLDPDIMEVRNIVTAREMVRENNWLLPTMNGELRIAKPPLPTWITALPILLTDSDDNLSAIRIPAGAAACLMVFFVFFLAKKLTSDQMIPFLAAAVAATSEFLILMGKQASWDIFCHSFMLGAIWLLVSAWRREEYTFRLYLFAGIFMGLSFMSKGPIAFHSMLLPFLLSYIHVFGYKQLALKWRGNIVAIFVLLLIAAAWPLYLYFNLPESVITVGTTEVNSWVFKHSKPIWYYLPFPVHSGVWLCLLVAALFYPLFKNKQFSFSDSNNYKLLQRWIIWTVVLLTIVPKKSTHYLLPIVVPTSLLIGFYMKYLITAFLEKRETRADRVVIAIHESILIILSIACLVIYQYYVFDTGKMAQLRSYIPAVVFAGIGIFSFFCFRQKKVYTIFITTILFVCFFCFLMPPVILHMGHPRSFMALKMSRQETRDKSLAFYSSYEMDMKEIWAVGQRVKKINADSLYSVPKPLAFFSKRPLGDLLRKKGLSPGNIQLTRSFVDKHSKKTWYLSLIDKKK